MTNKKAKMIIERMLSPQGGDGKPINHLMIVEAFNLAIKALDEECTTTPHLDIDEMIPSYIYAKPKNSLESIKEYLKGIGCEDSFIEKIDDRFCVGFGTAKQCVIEFLKKKYWTKTESEEQE